MTPEDENEFCTFASFTHFLVACSHVIHTSSPRATSPRFCDLRIFGFFFMKNLLEEPALRRSRFRMQLTRFRGHKSFFSQYNELLIVRLMLPKKRFSFIRFGEKLSTFIARQVEAKDLFSTL